MTSIPSLSAALQRSSISQDSLTALGPEFNESLTWGLLFEQLQTDPGQVLPVGPPAPRMTLCCKLAQESLRQLGEPTIAGQNLTLRSSLCQQLLDMKAPPARVAALFEALKKVTDAPSLAACWKQYGFSKEELEGFYLKAFYPEEALGKLALQLGLHRTQAAHFLRLMTSFPELLTLPLKAIFCMSPAAKPAAEIVSFLKKQEVFAFTNQQTVEEALQHALLAYWARRTLEMGGQGNPTKTAGLLNIQYELSTKGFAKTTMLGRNFAKEPGTMNCEPLDAQDEAFLKQLHALYSSVEKERLSELTLAELCVALPASEDTSSDPKSEAQIMFSYSILNDCLFVCLTAFLEAGITRVKGPCQVLCRKQGSMPGASKFIPVYRLIHSRYELQLKKLQKHMDALEALDKKPSTKEEQSSLLREACGDAMAELRKMQAVAATDRNAAELRMSYTAIFDDIEFTREEFELYAAYHQGETEAMAEMRSHAKVVAILDTFDKGEEAHAIEIVTGYVKAITRLSDNCRKFQVNAKPAQKKGESKERKGEHKDEPSAAATAASSRSLDATYAWICEGDEEVVVRDTPSPKVGEHKGTPSASAAKKKKAKLKKKQSASPTPAKSRTPSPTTLPPSPPAGAKKEISFAMKLSEMSGRLREVAAQLETGAKSGFTSAPSLRGAASSYVYTMADDLRPKLLQTPKPTVATLHDHFNATIAESTDHLFLSTQDLEIFAESILAKRYDEAYVALINLLIDTHVSMEQRMALRYMLRHNLRSEGHDLIQLAQGAGIELTQVQSQFLQNMTRALIWARYPHTSIDHYTSEGTPLPPALQWIQVLSQTTPSKADLTRVIQGVFACYENSLQFVVGDEYRDQVAELHGFLGVLENTTLSSLDRETAFPSTQPISEAFRAARERVQRATRPSAFTSPALLPLKEALHYLTWIGTASRMRLDRPDPRLTYWHARNHLKIDTAFEQIYRCRTIAFGARRRPTHDLSVYHRALTILDDEFLSAPSQKRIEGMMQGIANHYANTHRGPWTPLCRHLLAESRAAVLAPEGWTYASGKAKEAPETSLDTLLNAFNMALGFLSNQATAAVDQLAAQRPAAQTTQAAQIRA